MKELRLRVLFNCRERIYSDEVCIGYKPMYECQEYLKNWQEVLDYIESKNLEDIECDIFNIVPDEIPF